MTVSPCNHSRNRTTTGHLISQASVLSGVAGAGSRLRQIPPRRTLLGAPRPTTPGSMLLLTLPSALPPHAIWPVSWRYCSLPRSMGRHRTLGDLYAISWRQGAYPQRSLCIWCLESSSCICMSSLLRDCPCLLHVKNHGLVDLVCTSMQDGEEWAWDI